MKRWAISPLQPAITFAADEVSKALAEAIGAEKLVDKSNIVEELVPAILELAAEPHPA